MFLFQDLGRNRGLDRSREKHRLKIAAAERFEGPMPLKQVVVELGESQFVIEVQTRLELIRRKHFARGHAEGFGKGREVILAHRQAGGHFVTSKFFQPRFATAKRINE